MSLIPSQFPALLKSATIEDLETLLTLDQACFGKLWSRDHYLRELESPNSDIVILYDAKTGQPVSYGCVWAIVDEAHITILGTHPDHQRNGYARQVLSGLLHLAVLRELKRSTLEVRASNEAALSLYESFGFEVAGRRKKYYSDNQEDALILWRNKLSFDPQGENRHQIAPYF
jgi:[ribosomal protein S18]-alanine N-acetyltransferase